MYNFTHKNEEIQTKTDTISLFKLRKIDPTYR